MSTWLPDTYPRNEGWLPHDYWRFEVHQWVLLWNRDGRVKFAGYDASIDEVLPLPSDLELLRKKVPRLFYLMKDYHIWQWKRYQRNKSDEGKDVVYLDDFLYFLRSETLERISELLRDNWKYPVQLDISNWIVTWLPHSLARVINQEVKSIFSKL